MARKKQHLRYQAKKGRLKSSSKKDKSESALTVDSGTVAKADSLNNQSKIKKSNRKKKDSDYTKLPSSETQFVRREIYYIGFIAVILTLLYLIIFIIFRYTEIDTWLSNFIKLEG